MDPSAKPPPSGLQILGLSFAGGLGIAVIGGLAYALIGDRLIAHGLGTGLFIVGMAALAMGLLAAIEPPEGWRKNKMRRSAASKLAVESGATDEAPSSVELLVWGVLVGGGLIALAMVAFYFAAR